MKPRFLSWLTTASAAGLCRVLVAWCVAGSLLTAPIAAAAHELQHLHGSQQDAQDTQGHPKLACEVCAAYAGFGHALAFASSAPQILPPLAPEASAAAPHAESAPLHHYLERAPPHFPLVA